MSTNDGRIGRGIVCAIFLTAALAHLTGAAPPRPSIFVSTEFDSALGRINDLSFSGDGRLVAGAGAQGFGVWDAQTGSPIRKGTNPRPLTRSAITSDGIRLAHGDDAGHVSVVDLRSGVVTPMPDHKRAITALAWSPDGHLGASGDLQGQITLWDANQGPLGALSEHKKEIVLLAFDGTGAQLVSVSKDLQVITWDVGGKRPIRRSTLQADIAGRTITPNSASIDADGAKFLVGAQLVSEPRGGMLTDRGGSARPSDLRRENMLLSYNIATGLSPDPVRTGDFLPDRVAISPGGCFSFFTSTLRDQARLHIWSLLDQGDDMVRDDLSALGTAIALDKAGAMAAVASVNGRVKIWRVSGARAEDCKSFLTKTPTTATQQPTVVAGPETTPLIDAPKGLRLAVLRFESTGLDPSLGDGVAEMVAGQMSNNREIVVIERAAIDSIVKELEIQKSGLTTSDAVKIGKGLNARKVMLGSIRRFGANTFVILARLVDVETQQVEGSREVTCQNCGEQDLPKAIETLRRMLAR